MLCGASRASALHAGCLWGGRRPREAGSRGAARRAALSARRPRPRSGSAPLRSRPSGRAARVRPRGRAARHGPLGPTRFVPSGSVGMRSATRWRRAKGQAKEPLQQSAPTPPTQATCRARRSCASASQAREAPVSALYLRPRAASVAGGRRQGNASWLAPAGRGRGRDAPRSAACGRRRTAWPRGGGGLNTARVPRARRPPSRGERA